MKARYAAAAVARAFTVCICRARRHVRLTAVLALTLAVTSAAFCAAPPTDEQIVASLFPASLLNDPTFHGHEVDFKQYDFVRADLDGTGSADYLVVAYYNGIHDEVRVIRAVAGSAPSVAADLGLKYIGSAPGHISLADLDGDHKPEILLSIPLPRGSQDWLLKWSPGALKLFGPTKTDRSGRTFTDLYALRLVDVDGDGIPELLVPNNEGFKVYHFGATGYVVAPTVITTYHLVRTSGDPDALATGLVVNKPGAYVVTIVNGDAAGNHRSTAAYVEVNGTVLFPESAFKKADRTLTANVPLKDTNELYVELRGTPGSELTVTITKAGE
jgi:hypothetical protein